MHKYTLFFTVLFSFFLFSNCAANSDGNHPRGSEISTTWELLSVQLESKHKSRVAFTFVNNGRRLLGNSGWVIYFNQIAEHVIPESLTAEIRIENITGEYYKLYPTRDFQPLKPGQCKTFEQD
ncbi:MAG: carbohydate-binding domain-containing protein [Candidatus Marinimicrobia bacterium]|nr:carbohydate-binding domain-containing protein [Candidatus Neomarinimicrobiota bacterium]